MMAMADITTLLQRVSTGDREAETDLLESVYGELRKLASHFMNRERKDHTLQPTALVHEAYMRIGGNAGATWECRAHFFNAAAVAMRRILVDHARSRTRQKRGSGATRVELDDISPVIDSDPDQVIDIDTALTALAAFDPRQARIVELRYFCGLNVEETAAALNTSERTVKRDWSVARAWLEAELQKVPRKGPTV